MSIADGRKIMIRFTQPLIGDILGNETKFTVSFYEYDMVPEGSVSKVTRQVQGLANGYVSIDRQVDLQSGILDSAVVIGGALRLEEIT